MKKGGSEGGREESRYRNKVRSMVCLTGNPSQIVSQ